MTIDGKTKVGLFSVAALIPTIMGVAAWAVKVEAKAEQSLRNDEELKNEVKENRVMFRDIQDRLIRIESNQRRR